MLVDSHCHLNLDGLSEQTSNVIHRARKVGVEYFLSVCCDLEEIPDLQKIASLDEKVFISVGVHPNVEFHEEREPSIEDLVKFSSYKHVIALGETGLDYFRTSSGQDWQKERFRNHIRASVESKKPLIIHSRAAPQDTINIMKETEAHNAGGVMHCFSENWETAKAALDMGFYISFSGNVTFKRSDDLRDIAKQIPNDRILIETDSPYLAPVPYRGTLNEPSLIINTAQMLADLRSVSLEEFAELTTSNFFRLFKSAKNLDNE